MHVSYNEYILDNFLEEGVKGSLESISFIQCHYSRKSFRALIFPTDIFTVMTEEFSRGMYTYNLDKKESTLCSFAQSRFETLWANECGEKRVRNLSLNLSNTFCFHVINQVQNGEAILKKNLQKIVNKTLSSNLKTNFLYKVCSN